MPDRVLHWCSYAPCSQIITEGEPMLLTEDGWMHPGCADEAMGVRGE